MTTRRLLALTLVGLTAALTIGQLAFWFIVLRGIEVKIPTIVGVDTGKVLPIAIIAALAGHQALQPRTRSNGVMALLFLAVLAIVIFIDEGGLRTGLSLAVMFVGMLIAHILRMRKPRTA